MVRGVTPKPSKYNAPTRPKAVCALPAMARSRQATRTTANAWIHRRPRYPARPRLPVLLASAWRKWYAAIVGFGPARVADLPKRRSRAPTLENTPHELVNAEEHSARPPWRPERRGGSARAPRAVDRRRVGRTDVAARELLRGPRREVVLVDQRGSDRPAAVPCDVAALARITAGVLQPLRPTTKTSRSGERPGARRRRFSARRFFLGLGPKARYRRPAFAVRLAGQRGGVRGVVAEIVVSGLALRKRRVDANDKSVCADPLGRGAQSAQEKLLSTKRRTRSDAQRKAQENVLGTAAPAMSFASSMIRRRFTWNRSARAPIVV